MHLVDEYLPNEDAEIPPRFDSPEKPDFTNKQGEPVKLERRGVTRQLHQQLLWSKQTIHKNSIAAKLRQVGRDEEASTLENCHTHYTIAVCTACGQVNKFPNRCDNFFCPECQPRLSADRKKAVEWWTREISQPKHVVLTVKNILDLTKAHVIEFKKWLTNLRKRKFAANWRGGFYSLEVTKEGAGWHLHAHLLVDAKWIDAIHLSDQWQQANGGFGRIVKVKDARQHNYLAEVTKYAVKGSELAAWSGSDTATFIDAFRGVRTFGVFGSLYGKRTQFAEWWKQVRGSKPICNCGCCTAYYFEEATYIMNDLVPTPTNAAIPPPKTDLTPELKLNGLTLAVH